MQNTKHKDSSKLLFTCYNNQMSLKKAQRRETEAHEGIIVEIVKSDLMSGAPEV